MSGIEKATQDATDARLLELVGDVCGLLDIDELRCGLLDALHRVTAIRLRLAERHRTHARGKSSR